MKGNLKMIKRMEKDKNIMKKLGNQNLKENFYPAKKNLEKNFIVMVY